MNNQDSNEEKTKELLKKLVGVEKPPDLKKQRRKFKNKIYRKNLFSNPLFWFLLLAVVIYLLNIIRIITR